MTNEQYDEQSSNDLTCNASDLTKNKQTLLSETLSSSSESED